MPNREILFTWLYGNSAKEDNINDSWTLKLEVDKNGLYKSSIKNIVTILENDKNLKETIVDGEIKDISYDINVGGFGVQIFKNDNEIKRILKEENLKNKYETLDCYFQNEN